MKTKAWIVKAVKQTMVPYAVDSGTHPGRGLLVHPALAQHLRLSEWLPGGGQHKARLRFTP
jgi:hypothetical protein